MPLPQGCAGSYHRSARGWKEGTGPQPGVKWVFRFFARGQYCPLRVRLGNKLLEQKPCVLGELGLVPFLSVCVPLPTPAATFSPRSEQRWSESWWAFNKGLGTEYGDTATGRALAWLLCNTCAITSEDGPSLLGSRLALSCQSLPAKLLSGYIALSRVEL